jgi:putative membrane protein
MQRFCNEAEAYQANITAALQNIDALKTSVMNTKLNPDEEAAVKEALIQSGRSQADAEAFIAAYSRIPDELDKMQQFLSSEAVTPPALDLTKTENAINALTPAIQNLNQDLGILQQYIMLIQTGISQIEGLPAMVTGLKSGAAALAEGSRQLKTGMCAYTDGVSKLYDGASQLADGAGQLPDAGGKLMEGYTSILDGVWSLTDGVKKFDQEGIKELTKLGGSQLQDMIRRVKALHRIEDTYTNYSGIPEGVEGSVRFMIETEEIKADKE